MDQLHAKAARLKRVFAGSLLTRVQLQLDVEEQQQLEWPAWLSTYAAILLEAIMHAPANVLDLHFLVNRLICFLWDCGWSIGKVKRTAIKRDRALGNNYEVLYEGESIQRLHKCDVRRYIARERAPVGSWVILQDSRQKT
jgi:hypothetical protein